MQKSNLCLHAGAHAVPREALEAVRTPERTQTWVPIAHQTLLTGVIGSLESNGLHVVTESHALGKGGNRYFGLLQVANGHNSDDFGLVVGIRNSHDKTFPAGIVVGASVFVCDNLSFSGEIKLARKHTVHVERDLPNLIARAMGKLTEHRDTQEKRFQGYRITEFTDAQAHDIIIRAVDAQVCPVTMVPHVLKEWRTPRHPEFAQDGKTGWRLWNSFTEILKSNLDALPKRTMALHGIIDVACKIDGREVVATVA